MLRRLIQCRQATGQRNAGLLRSAIPSSSLFAATSSAGSTTASFSASSSSSASLAAVSRRSLSTAAGAGKQAEASSSSAGSGEVYTFQAETKQLLNIVTNSLYTDKHIFVRELISNASDALEKLRHRQAAGDPAVAPEVPLAISLSCDETGNTITFADTGIGMDKQELMDNLGTIARSGSRAFMEKLRSQQQQGGSSSGSGAELQANIIGQFGVGFYSGFMVADRMTVTTLSARPGSKAYQWTSQGDGSYEITELSAEEALARGVQRGTRIHLQLKDSCREFCSPAAVRDIIKRYSNFVPFPISLDGKPVNTVQAIWAMSKSEVTEEQYSAFYQYKSGDFEAPLYRLHFSADAPIALKALLFIGQSHEEKYGMGRMKPGADLYSRKVLIEAGSRVLPDWLRFLQGVVDSEDIPLNISRESMQDSALMKRLRSVLTRRVLRFLESEARRDPEAFNGKFFPEFGNFLKEGAITDNTFSAEIARLLRFESSALPAGQLTSLDEYLSRMPPGQDSIYYLMAPSRGIAEGSPYLEAFKGRGQAVGGDSDGLSSSSSSQAGVEVLFLYSPIDDFVMNNLREFNGRKLTTAETAELDPSKLQGIAGKADASAPAANAEEAARAAAAEALSGGVGTGTGAAGGVPSELSESEVNALASWIAAALPDRVSRVKATNRLRSSPAVVTDHESAAIRRMMRMVEQTAGRDSEALKAEQHMLPKQTLEINPRHPVIVRLHRLKDAEPELARLVSEQLVDNALVAAGLVDDSRVLLPRLNALLEKVTGAATAAAVASAGAGAGVAASSSTTASPAASAGAAASPSASGSSTSSSSSSNGSLGGGRRGGSRYVPPGERKEREALDISAEIAEGLRRMPDLPAVEEQQQTAGKGSREGSHILGTVPGSRK